MARKTQTQIKCLTVSAMLSALGVVLLAIGSVFETLDLSIAVIASIFVVYAVIELGGAYPWMVWLVTSIVSFLLLPIKSSVLFYIFLAGFYPILKEKIERRCPRVPAYLIKGSILVLACAAIWSVSYLFFPYLLDGNNSLPYLILLIVVGVITFYLYDYALTMLISFYLKRLHNRLKIKK